MRCKDIITLCMLNMNLSVPRFSLNDLPQDKYLRRFENEKL